MISLESWMQPGTPRKGWLRRGHLPSAPCTQNILNSISLLEKNTVCMAAEPSHVSCSERFFPAGLHCLCLDLDYKHLSTMRETWIQSLGWKDPLEKEMAVHARTIAWKIPWTEEPGRLQSMGSQRVGHNWATLLISSLRTKGTPHIPASCSSHHRRRITFTDIYKALTMF